MTTAAGAFAVPTGKPPAYSGAGPIVQGQVQGGAQGIAPKTVGSLPLSRMFTWTLWTVLPTVTPVMLRMSRAIRRPRSWAIPATEPEPVSSRLAPNTRSSPVGSNAAKIALLGVPYDQGSPIHGLVEATLQPALSWCLWATHRHIPPNACL